MTTTNSTTPAKDQVFIFDTTLRDGEQCPGATMTFEEKLEVADLLEAMGVDIIEAGFPIASDGDFEAVTAIAKRIKNSVVAGLARAGMKDIDRAGEAVKNAARPRIHTFLSTSPVHMKFKLQKSPEEVLQMVTDSGDPRPQLGRQRRMVGRGWYAHRDGLPDAAASTQRSRPAPPPSTSPIRSATPRRTNTGRMFRTVRERVANSDKAVFSVHCHNDLGMAVANSLAGARRRCPPDRVHHQRHRRAGRQRRARRDRDGDQDPQRRAAL